MSVENKYVYPKKNRLCRYEGCKANINHLHRAKRFCDDTCRDLHRGQNNSDERSNEFKKGKKKEIDPKWLVRNYSGSKLGTRSSYSCMDAGTVD